MALQSASFLIWAGRVFAKPWLSAPGVDMHFRSSTPEPPQTSPAATQGMLLRVRTTAFLSGAAIAGAFALFKLRQDFARQPGGLVRSGEAVPARCQVQEAPDTGGDCSACIVCAR